MRKRQRYDPFADTSRDPLSSKLPRPTGGAAAARWGGSSDLSQELHALADYVAPSPEEDRARHDLVERLRDLLASMAPGSQCELFGSWPAGLSTWDGDIDVAVSGGGVSLEALAARLRVEGWAERVEHISSARVPIVTFQDRRSELWCDVSLATGVGRATRSFVQRYASRHAAFRPVCVLLKLLLDQQQLHKAYRGGVSSYRVYVLVAHLLDSQPSAAALPAGPLLLLALEHFGRRVDWQVWDGTLPLTLTLALTNCAGVGRNPTLTPSPSPSPNQLAGVGRNPTLTPSPSPSPDQLAGDELALRRWRQ